MIKRLDPDLRTQPNGGGMYYSEAELARRIEDATIEIATMRPQPQAHWALDKKVPLALIIALVTQTLIIVAVGAQWRQATESRLAYLEQVDIDRKGQEPRLIRLEERISVIGETISRIDERMAQGIKAP